MAVEDEYVEIGGSLWHEPVQAEVAADEKLRLQIDRKVRSSELSTRAMALKKSSA